MDANNTVMWSRTQKAAIIYFEVSFSLPSQEILEIHQQTFALELAHFPQLVDPTGDVMPWKIIQRAP